MKAVLADYCTYAGPCLWDEGGRHVTFNMRGVWISVLENTWTDGVELKVWGIGKTEPQVLTRVTPDVLEQFFEWLVVYLGLDHAVLMESEVCDG